jgi:putative PIN family toxin of toxin-antitoxin system
LSPVRVVFDTNIVLSALVFGRRLAWLRAAWARGVAIPVVCRETTVELLRVLAYPKFELAPSERDLLLAEYLPFAEAAQLPVSLPMLPVACRDRDDVVFIHLALAAKVDCLVSGDHDLGVLRDVAAVPIISADELRRQLWPFDLRGIERSGGS